MLQKLQIQHLVLADSCELECSKGFHVITGETGAGKSIVLTAISLLMGERADSTLVRQGEELAVIEGVFLQPLSPELDSLLSDLEIFPLENQISIRREILRSGKSRASICDQPVSVQALRSVCSHLIEVSDQQAYLTLQTPQTQLELVDRYANTQEKAKEFAKAFHHYATLHKRLNDLCTNTALRDVEIEAITKRIGEIEESGVLDSDEEAMFQQLQLLEEKKETLELGYVLLQDLEAGKTPLLTLLTKSCQQIEKFVLKSPAWSESCAHFNQARENIRSGLACVQKMLADSDYPEKEHEKLETQLGKIQKLHRSYGDIASIRNAYDTMKEKLRHLQETEQEIEKINHELLAQSTHGNKLAHELRTRRNKAAAELSPLVESRLRDLNMPNARFEIRITPTTRTSFGDDSILFLITPNLGEKQISIDAVSGGELARIYLAIQAELASHFSVPTVVFDEVDSGIGGITAHAVGKALADMGTHRQVFAITHLVQVATQAQTHFVLTKVEKDQRTYTTVKKLHAEKERLQEHQRMTGYAKKP